VRLGIDVGGTKLEGVCLEAGGRELVRRRIPTPTAGYGDVLDAIAHLVEGLEQGAGAAGETLPTTGVRVGVGCPGFLAPSDGLIRNSNLQALNGRAFDRDLAARLGRPVRVANDANCFVLSETLDGAATIDATPDADVTATGTARPDVVFGATLGTGVGGGLVVGGRVWGGANGSAGEWSHLSLPYLRAEDAAGSGCYCGRPACIESFLCGRGLEWDHRRATGASVPAREVGRLAGLHEPAALATLRRYADRLARALTLVVDLVDPRAIVLGGGIATNRGLFEDLPARLEGYTVAKGLGTRIVAARHGDASGVRGAARLWE
jgi:fructokinase